MLVLKKSKIFLYIHALLIADFVEHFGYRLRQHRGNGDYNQALDTKEVIDGKVNINLCR